jgi:hypothetical protein
VAKWIVAKERERARCVPNAFATHSNPFLTPHHLFCSLSLRMMSLLPFQLNFLTPVSEMSTRAGPNVVPLVLRLPEERRQTEQCISPIKGRQQWGLDGDDTYAGGERSGKRAKPNATTTAANARAHAAAALPPSVA